MSLSKEQITIIETEAKDKCEKACNYIYLSDSNEKNKCLEKCLADHEEYFKIENKSNYFAIAAISILIIICIITIKIKYSHGR